MFRTLVTIGYHYGELEWGRQVRDAYLQQNPNGTRKISFHEIGSSAIETANVCPKSLAEVVDAFERGNFNFWIDVHCGFTEIYWGRIFLSYRGNHDLILERAKEIEGVAVSDTRNQGEPDIIKKYSKIDPFFPETEFVEQGEIYRKALNRTIRFINEIHDIHLL